MTEPSGSHAEPALALKAVTVDLGGRRVLEHLELAVGRGELCALVGSSGAGKTSVLRAIAGLVPLRSGTISLDGARVDGRPTHRRGVAVCFQEPRLFPSMSVVDNVAYGLRVRGERRAGRRAAACELLDEVGLGRRVDDAVTDLSGGEQQRVALARALCARPRLLLLDEPLASVDAPRRAELRALVRDVQRRHAITTIMVTHELADATAIADSVAVLEAGRAVQHDVPSAIVARPATPLVARLSGNPNLLWDPPGPGATSVPWTIRPEHVTVVAEGVDGRVVAAEHRVTHVRLVVHGAYGELEVHVPATSSPAVGATIGVHVDPADVWRFPRSAAADAPAVNARD